MCDTTREQGQNNPTLLHAAHVPDAQGSEAPRRSRARSREASTTNRMPNQYHLARMFKSKHKRAVASKLCGRWLGMERDSSTSPLERESLKEYRERRRNSSVMTCEVDDHSSYCGDFWRTANALPQKYCATVFLWRMSCTYSKCSTCVLIIHQHATRSISLIDFLFHPCKSVLEIGLLFPRNYVHVIFPLVTTATLRSSSDHAP